MKHTLTVFAVAILTVSAMAQDKPAANAAKAATKKAPAAQGGMPPAAKPSPEMQKMAKLFVGKWTTLTKTEPMGGMPGGEAKGEATFYRGPGGLSLIEDFKSVGGGFGNFRGHGVSYWDEKAKNYAGVWCDSMTPGGCSSAGTSKWDGDKIVGYMEMPDEKGQLQKYRMTYSDIKPESVTFTMEAPDGSNYKPMMTIVYTRAGGAATPAAKKE
jgi:hypothetical protein